MAVSRGLSPRVRGNLGTNPGSAGLRRSIPACAGEPVAADTSRRAARVYPRVCGGTSLPHWKRWPAKGLSPRVRGNLSDAGRNGEAQRSIPACAGEPMAAPPVGPPPSGMGSIPACAGEPDELGIGGGGRRVYPRVCGGTGYLPPLPSIGRGLSPRVRGNPPARLNRSWRAWSIPACAGEPAAGVNVTGIWEGIQQVYPRVCGGTAPFAGSKATP